MKSETLMGAHLLSRENDIKKLISFIEENLNNNLTEFKQGEFKDLKRQILERLDSFESQKKIIEE